MTDGQPPGWNQPPGSGQPGGAPQQPGWSQQPQPAPPQAPGWQQAQPPQGWPPPAQGGPQAQPGWHDNAPAGAVGGSVGFGGAAPGVPVKKVGLFDKMPCPQCGAQMSSHAGMGGTAGRVVGGLVGWLIVSALASSYYCPTHGETPKSALPAEHRSVATMRMLAMLGGAGALLVLVFGCVIFSSVLQAMR